jgi:hypothetical protein
MAGDDRHRNTTAASPRTSAADRVGIDRDHLGHPLRL